MNGLAEPAPASNRPARLSLTLAPIILIVLGFAPLLWVFFQNLWARPHYQFFPLTLAGAAFLAWLRLKEVPRPLSGGGPRATLVLSGATFALLVAATALWSPWLGSLAALLGGIAAIWLVGGRKLLRAMAPALVLVLVVIPPPLSLDTRFAESLRGLAVNWSSHLLDLSGVVHSQSGNVIELPGKKLLVEEACSGINSLLITMAGCLFYMLWRRASVICTILAVLGSISFVVLGNLLRITIGAWLKFHRNVDILSGWRHEAIGLLLFLVYMLLIFSLDRFLFFLTRPSRRRRRQPMPQAPVEPPPSVRVIQPRWLGLAACAFALLGLAQIGRGWTHARHVNAQPVIPKSALKNGATFTLPGQIGQWVRINEASPMLQKVETLGVFSQVWHFQRSDLVASVALDYPFSGYHDVTMCYTMRGWQVLERSSGEVKDSRGTVPCAEVQMLDELGLRGALWFSTVDEHGNWIELPVSQRAFLDRWKVSGKNEPTTYRVQVLVTSYAPLPARDLQHVKDFFEQARLLLWEQLKTQMR